MDWVDGSRVASPPVTVVVVNWNGWADTIECLESVLRSAYPAFRVVVCDNGSRDASMSRIMDWAEGRLDVRVPPDHPLRPFSFPPLPKPITYRCYARAEAEAGGTREDEGVRLVLVQTGANLGFAGGVNVALRYVLARGDTAFVWLLNNDTVVHANALAHLVRGLRGRTDAGMCGSTVLYYDAPDTVQALGGARYNPWFGFTWCIGLLHPASRRIDPRRVERRLAYVLGASMLISVRFLADVGLMCEEYFLYFEELDWAVRARGRYTLAYVPESLVYHKEGASAGTSWSARKRSLAADYFLIRNRLRVTRKFYPFALPTVYLGLLASLLLRAGEWRWDRVTLIVRLALGLGSGPTLPPISPFDAEATGHASPTLPRPGGMNDDGSP